VPQTTLEVENITKTFTSIRAVDGLSFTARSGSVFGLLGPNGAGKTTTIRMVLDIIDPDSGRIIWQGRAVDANVRRTFGYLPEERGLYPKMKVRDQLMFLGQLHGLRASDAKKTIEGLAAELNLTEHLEQAPQELSKGNQQKVQFIAAVVHAPPLLVLDEPFSGFDPVNVEVVKRSIRELVARDTTVVLSSHRMEQVEELCEDVCIIDRSRAVQSGNLREIKRDWPDRFIRMTKLPNTDFLKAFPGASILPSRDGFLDVKLPAGQQPVELARAAMAAGPLDHFEVVEPSLNDIYLAAVKPEATA
jgi:ABC-2 type transport system ATP-binding protein